MEYRGIGRLEPPQDGWTSGVKSWEVKNTIRAERISFVSAIVVVALQLVHLLCEHCHTRLLFRVLKWDIMRLSVLRDTFISTLDLH